MPAVNMVIPAATDAVIDTRMINHNADKTADMFRNYVEEEGGGERQAVVSNHYRMMRENQTVAFASRMGEKWGTFDRAEMTVLEAFQALEGYIDSSLETHPLSSMLVAVSPRQIRVHYRVAHTCSIFI